MSRRSSRRAGYLVILTGATAFAASVVWAGWILSTTRQSAGDTAAIVALPVALLAALPVFGWLADRRVNLTEAAEDLAHAVRAREGEERVRLLGDDTIPIDVSYTLAPSGGREAAGAAAHGKFSDAAEYYQRLRPRRLVITGPAGAGKTVLGIELMLRLLDHRRPDDPVPVRVSLPGWNAGTSLTDWLAGLVAGTYDISRSAARRLAEEGRLLPLLDGLDELAPEPDEDGWPPSEAATGRMAALVALLNGYRPGGQPGALILTSRTGAWERLAEAGASRLRDAARIAIQPVTPDQAAEYLYGRTTHQDRWLGVCDSLLSDPHSVVASVLSTPWRLNLAFTVFESPGDPAELLRYDDADALHADLLDRYVPAVLSQVSRGPVPRPRHQPEHVAGWLRELAGYLEANRDNRTVAGRPLSGSDIAPADLWPMGGLLPVWLFDWLLQAACFLLILTPFLSTGFFRAAPLGVTGFLVALALAVATGGRRPWPRRRWADLRSLRRPGKIVTLMIAALVVGTAWWVVRKHVPQIRPPAVCIMAGAVVVVAVVRARLPGSVEPPEVTPRAALRRAGASGLLTGLVFGTALVLLAAAATPLSGSPAGWAGLAVAGALAAGVAALGFSAVWRRYLAMLLATRGRLPWRLTRFLGWATEAGLLRMAGPAYQFRHRELQEHLARSAQKRAILPPSSVAWVISPRVIRTAVPTRRSPSLPHARATFATAAAIFPLGALDQIGNPAWQEIDSLMILLCLALMFFFIFLGIRAVRADPALQRARAESRAAAQRAARAALGQSPAGIARLLMLAAALTGIGFAGAGISGVLAERTTLADVYIHATTSVPGMIDALNEAMLSRDEPAFLSWFAPSAQSVVEQWWQNLTTIGMTGGFVALTDSLYFPCRGPLAVDPFTGALPLDSHGDATVRLIAGASSPQDATSDSFPLTIAAACYQVTIHRDSSWTQPQITAWQPLDDAPWDAPAKLYARGVGRVTVAGSPGERQAVDQAAVTAQAAARYVLSLPGLRTTFSLVPPGFVAFVPASQAQWAQWFSGLGRVGVVSQYTAVGLYPPSSGLPAVPSLAIGVTGAPRVVLAPAAQNAQAPTLVNLFAQDLLATDGAFSNTPDTPDLVPLLSATPPWAVDGFGELVEALYRTDPGAPGRYSLSWLDTQLRALPASSRTGQLPTAADLTGPQAVDWSIVAASVYAYLGQYRVQQDPHADRTTFITTVEKLASVAEEKSESPFDAYAATFAGKAGGGPRISAATAEGNWRRWLLSQV